MIAETAVPLPGPAEAPRAPVEVHLEVQRVRQTFLVVANPMAGRRLATLAGRVVAALRHRGATVRQAALSFPFTSADLRPEPNEAVIACGGDGTLRAIGAALGSSDVPVGIVPSGTANVMAHELGLPRHPAAIADLLLEGPVARLAGAEANGQPFFLMAGVGFDAAVMHSLDAGLKRRVGQAAVAWPVLRTLSAPAPRLEVEIDGARHAAASVIVARARSYAGRYVLVPGGGLHRSGLHAVLLKSESRRARLRQLAALGLGRLERDADVMILPAERVSVRAATPVPVQLDGDPAGATPLEIRAGGPAMSLIVPPAFLERCES